jgi:hypothetical protein
MAVAGIGAGRAIEGLTLEIEPDVASKAEHAARRLPVFSDEELCQPEAQLVLAAGLAERNRGWAALIAALCLRFDRDGIAVVRGVRFDAENRLLVGLLASLGRVAGDGNPGGRAVFDLFTKERPAGKPDFELFFHTGSYFRARPHEVLALLCVQPGAEGGGSSRLARLDVVLERMRRDGQAAAIDVLRRPALFKRPRRFGGGYLEAPILSEVGEGPGWLQVRFERRRVMGGAAHRTDGDPDLVAAVTAFELAATRPGSYLEYSLKADELLIVDNRRVLHARGEVPGGRAAGRHLKRVKAYRP